VPSFDQIDSLGAFVFRLKFNEILGYEARSTGLESSDEFKTKMRRFKELTMAEMMKDSIPQPPPPEDNELLEYYETHLSEYTTPAKVHLFEVLVADEAQAKQLRKEIRTLSKLQEAAAELTERGGKRNTKGDLGLIERTWFPNIFDEAQKIPIGGMGGPISSLGKWSVFYVADKMVEEVKSYDAVKRNISETLSNKLRNEAFSLWVENVKSNSDITLYEDVVSESIDADKYPAISGVQQDSLGVTN
jgi:parvulin-like peptidyl-prolyl isomerase